MAYQYDQMGNLIGDFETEEERRRREELAAKEIAQTVEVKTYGDGRQVQTTTQQLPQAAGPVSPDTFARMQQVESGNRDFDAQGRPITSSAGAMFRNQVMPSTAAQPGYGIRPAQSQTPEEYNRVGQEYYQAMLKQFGGDERAAAAAYNAGPGRVQQNMAANQGQLNPAQLPQETQGYLDKVFRGAGQAVTNMFPSAQAGTLPQGQAQRAPTITAPVAPGQQPYYGPGQGEEAQTVSAPVAPAAMAAQPQAGAAPTAAPSAEPSSMYSLGTGQSGLGLQMPGGPAATGIPQTTTSAINTYQAAQDDPKQLMALRYDDNAPEFIRERAGQRAYELMDMEIKKKEAAKQAQTLMASAAAGDRKAANDIAKTLTSGEGSWLKMIMLGFISPQMAGEEAIKLGFGNKWASAQDSQGNQGLIEYNAKGMPLRGVTADNRVMNEKELATFATGGAGGKVTTSGTFFQTPTGQILRAQSDEQGRPRLVDAASGARFTGSTQGLTKLEEAGAIRKMDRGLVIDLAKKHGENVLEAEKDFVAINGPFKNAEERQQFRDAYGFGLAQPAAVPGVAGFGGAPGAGASAGAAPAPQAGAGLSQAQRIQQSLPGAQAAPGTTPQAPAAQGGPVAPSGVTAPIAGMQTGVAINKEQQQAFVKYAAEDITPKADAGGQVSRIRKEQIKGPDGILSNPEIAGLLQGGKGSEVYNIFRDLATGNFKDQADLSSRVESLGLTPRQKDILYRQINLNSQVAPLTLKANAGAGAVSDAEQKANRAANIDITRQPLYAGIADLSRSQHINDMSVARADFKAANPQFQTTEQFNRAWSAEKAKRQKEYDQIFEARAQYIKKYGNTPGAVVDAFKYYPTPEWNSQTGSWDLGTDFARKAARPSLSQFNR
jgi:hypothetical protein